MALQSASMVLALMHGLLLDGWNPMAERRARRSRVLPFCAATKPLTTAFAQHRTTEVAMGLLDVLTGMRNGPRGIGGRAGGMSPITMALLGLLAYKAVKGIGGAGSRPDAMSDTRAGQPQRQGGGLDDLLRSGLGGVGLGGLGAVLSGGLGDLLKQFQGAGKSDVADSWVSTGQNEAIAPADLEKVLTPEQIEFLTERTGLSRDELLTGLADRLPKAVDSLTPEGRIPAAQDMNRVAELS
jgi:uncharacterized protein YidB (DUF937 family)